MSETLRVEDLHVHYPTPRGTVKAVDGVTFGLAIGDRFGLVGESGSGKSTIALALLRLLTPPGRVAGGRIMLGGQDLTALPELAMRQVRLARIALIPQGAMNSLNPVMRVKHQIIDGIRAHGRAESKGELKERVEELLASVGLRREVANRYPHELSGGMKQRVCIAIAICMEPKVIIADEPTSALDVVVQRQIMETLRAVQEDLGAAVILIGHDMGLMAQLVDRIAVMYAGHMVEIAPVQSLFDDPLHPYTQLLIESIPSIRERKPLKLTEGLTHDLRNPPPGCIFQLRCPYVHEKCLQVDPPLLEVKQNHSVACHLYYEV